MNRRLAYQIVLAYFKIHGKPAHDVIVYREIDNDMNSIEEWTFYGLVNKYQIIL